VRLVSCWSDLAIYGTLRISSVSSGHTLSVYIQSDSGTVRDA